MKKGQLYQAIGIMQGLVASQSQATQPVIDKEALEKAKQAKIKEIIQDTVMVGFCVNILLDRLDRLKDAKEIYLHELKKYGNLFKKSLEENEARIWENVSKNGGANDYLEIARIMDNSLGSLIDFTNEQFINLFRAIELIRTDSFIEVETESELESVKQGKALKEQIIAYVETHKMTQMETLQYLRSL